MALELEHLTEPVASVLADFGEIRLPLVKSELREHPKLRWFAEQRPESLFPETRHAAAAFSGLMLLLGGWRECHETAQDLASAEGSYWHAIAHRIEPDFWNSGYWFRRVGKHPIFEKLRDGAASLADGTSGANWKVGDVWDPLAFVKLCEELLGKRHDSRHQLAWAVQALEWELLFTWCAAPERF